MGLWIVIEKLNVYDSNFMRFSRRELQEKKNVENDAIIRKLTVLEMERTEWQIILIVETLDYKIVMILLQSYFMRKSGISIKRK